MYTARASLARRIPSATFVQTFAISPAPEPIALRPSAAPAALRHSPALRTTRAHRHRAALARKVECPAATGGHQETCHGSQRTARHRAQRFGDRFAQRRVAFRVAVREHLAPVRRARQNAKKHNQKKGSSAYRVRRKGMSWLTTKVCGVMCSKSTRRDGGRRAFVLSTPSGARSRFLPGAGFSASSGIWTSRRTSLLLRKFRDSLRRAIVRKRWSNPGCARPSVPLARLRFDIRGST